MFTHKENIYDFPRRGEGGTSPRGYSLIGYYKISHVLTTVMADASLANAHICCTFIYKLNTFETGCCALLNL